MLGHELAQHGSSCILPQRVCLNRVPVPRPGEDRVCLYDHGKKVWSVLVAVLHFALTRKSLTVDTPGTSAST